MGCAGAYAGGMTDRDDKRAAVLGLLERHAASSLLLTGTGALQWYLDGARVHIDLASGPILTVRVSPDGDEVHLGSNESERMLAEELPGDVRVLTHPWHSPVTPAADLVEADVASGLVALRRTLTPVEVRRFRELGADAAAILTDALQSATPETTGTELAARVTHDAVARGTEPLVVLVGGESRSAVRHPLPTDDPLGRRAMLVICARRHGLVADATRWVRFGPATAAEDDADARILEVEADAFAATRPGASLDDVLSVIRSAYPRHGFAEDEWLGHHQGGSAGYGTRETLATPGSSAEVALGQAFAWNPTAPGAKVEDTVLVTGTGVEPLTVDPRWPTTTVRGVGRPVVLER